MDQREKLWREYKLTGSETARDRLIEEYAYLAKYTVDRLNLSPSGALGYEDLIGHAVIGLIGAIEKFELERNVKFETYALTRIRGEVIDIIRSLDWTPRSVRRNETILRDAYARLEMELKRPPNDLEIANYMDVDVSEFEKMLADVGQSAVLSLDEVISSGGDVTVRGDGDEYDDPASCAERADQKRLLAKSIEELPERERQVVALYYYENLTQKEIAAVLSVTESRVCQIHTKAVLRLSGKLSRTSACFSMAA
ncbi:MAG: FliA/WhiG family RNA polymerase sigma factor [Armatimonadota bacterium]|nr:FliA/WhiG family RNA polymerase sigma factor [bacterium]